VVWVCSRGWCSHDQGDDLDRRVAGLSGWAAHAGGAVVPRWRLRLGSAINGARRTVQRLPVDPRVVTVVVEHRDRWGPMDTELVAAALWAHGLRGWWCGIAVRSPTIWCATWSKRPPGCGARRWAGLAPNRAITALGVRPAHHRAQTCRCHARG
jgi:hypothetical protein